jgi:hypothetical protein
MAVRSFPAGRPVLHPRALLPPPRTSSQDAPSASHPGHAPSRQASAALWAFATLGHTPTQLLERLAQGWAVKRQGAAPAAPARRRASSAEGTRVLTAPCSAHGAVRVGGRRPAASALASRRCATPSPSAERGPRGLRAFSAGQLSVSAWSLAVMGRTGSDAFAAIWAEVCRRGPRLAAERHHLAQIWQAALSLRLEGGGGGGGAGAGAGGGGGDEAADAEERRERTERLLAAAEAAFAGEAAALRGQVGPGGRAAAPRKHGSCT